MKKYEVQTYTLCDGWVNTWQIIHEDHTAEPETFDSYIAAEHALAEFLAEINEEIILGIREPEQGYRTEDFRIAKVTSY